MQSSQSKVKQQLRHFYLFFTKAGLFSVFLLSSEIRTLTAAVVMINVSCDLNLNQFESRPVTQGGEH